MIPMSRLHVRLIPRSGVRDRLLSLDPFSIRPQESIDPLEIRVDCSTLLQSVVTFTAERGSPRRFLALRLGRIRI